MIHKYGGTWEKIKTSSEHNEDEQNLTHDEPQNLNKCLGTGQKQKHKVDYSPESR